MTPPPPPPGRPASAPGGPDPTLARRARIARLTEVGQRLGYALFGLAIVAFVVGAVRGFDGATVATVTACLLVGSAVLAPAIVFGYAVKAAEREDRERDASREVPPRSGGS
ncbi:MAG: hypothetical protein NVSMB4_13100 [Acidimicrobiales bacterium]